jgi:hypothetical protein
MTICKHWCSRDGIEIMAAVFFCLAISHGEDEASRAGGEAVVVRIAASHVQWEVFDELSLIRWP